MLEDFATLIGQLFPSVDSEVARKCVQSMREGKPIAKELYAATLPSGICQADIISNLTFRITEDDGQWREYIGPGMVLSNSCDAENESYVSVCPCFPLDLISSSFSSSQISNLKANKLLSQFYLPGVSNIGDLVADLSITHSFNREYLERKIAQNEIQRLCAMSQLGYYLFVAKLTIHFLRPETAEITREPLQR